jgi:hypothetical protein
LPFPESGFLSYILVFEGKTTQAINRKLIAAEKQLREG